MADMREVERRILGADHEAFGAGLCEAWKFPKSFAYVAGHHHNPTELSADRRTLASLVSVADRLSGQFGYGFRTDLQSLEINQETMDDLGLSREQLEKVKGALPQAFEDIEATFS